MSPLVVLDANVLVPLNITDLLLRLAEMGTYQPLWSRDILAEVERALVRRIGLTEEQAVRRTAAMRTTFPNAMVDGYQPIVAAMTNHNKDRHVLAAAVRANAGVIVTANLKDFPAPSLAPHQIAAVGPDDFLLELFTRHPEQAAYCVRRMAQVRRRPPTELGELLDQCAETLPKFVAEVRRRL